MYEKNYWIRSLFRKIFTLGKILGLLVLSAGFFTAKGKTSL
jgi:hypothetical protein